MKEATVDDRLGLLRIRIRDYYRSAPDRAAGGWLHIVLEDGNIEDAHVRWCRDEAALNGDVVGSELAGEILELSETDREYLYSKSAEFYP
jgi:hypothetical protein